MKTIHKIILLIVTLSVISLQAAGVDKEATRRLLKMTSDELIERGRASKNPEEALLCFSIVVERIPAPSDREEGLLASRALNNCGHLYFHAFGEYSRSYSYFSKALATALKFDLAEPAIIAYLNLGNLYLTYANRHSSASETATARRYYRDGMELALKNKFYELAVLNFTNLCAIELDDLSPRRLPDDMQQFAATEIPDTTNGLVYAMAMYGGIRDALAGNLGGAREKMRRASGHIDARYSHERYEYAYYEFMARTFRREERWDSVLYYNRLIEELAMLHAMPDVRPDNFMDISESLGHLGDSAGKEAYRVKYLHAKDSLLSIGHLNEVGNMRLLDRIDSTKQELTEIQHEQEKGHRLLLAALAAIFVITLITVILITVNRRLRQKNEALYNSNLSLLESENKRRRTAAMQTRASGDNLLDEKQQDEIVRKIEETLDKPEVFCSPDFSLNDLVKACGSNTRYVSHVINDHYGHSFSQLLSDSRVKEACRRIDNDPAFTRLTVEAISAEVGFKSRVSFLTNFKRVTGLTPSQYIAIAKKRRKA